MKQWQIEEILYLNDSDKRKLILPQAQHATSNLFFSARPAKESLLVIFMRRVVSFFLKVL